MPNPLADATTKTLELLGSLSPDERLRVVKAALTLLGDSVSIKALSPASSTAIDDPDGSDDGESKLSGNAKAWAQKHAVTMPKLEKYFHIDGKASQAIAIASTSTKRGEQVLATYLQQGIVSLIITGEPNFSDEDGRKLCEHFGCYDSTNHAKYIKEFGNRIAGNKSGGWKLTAPGLTFAAELVKQGE